MTSLPVGRCRLTLSRTSRWLIIVVVPGVPHFDGDFMIRNENSTFPVVTTAIELDRVDEMAVLPIGDCPEPA